MWLFLFTTETLLEGCSGIHACYTTDTFRLTTVIFWTHTCSLVTILHTRNYLNYLKSQVWMSLFQTVWMSTLSQAALFCRNEVRDPSRFGIAVYPSCDPFTTTTIRTRLRMHYNRERVTRSDSWVIIGSSPVMAFWIPGDLKAVRSAIGVQLSLRVPFTGFTAIQGSARLWTESTMSIVECTEVILDAGDVNVPRERARRLWLSPRMNFNPLSIQTKHQNCCGKTIRFAIEMLCSGIWICNLLSFHLFLLNKQTYNCTSTWKLKSPSSQDHSDWCRLPAD